MKKYILHIVLMGLSYIGFAQELTYPQVEGYISGSTMKVSFPFAIKGVPFSQIQGSVWYPYGRVVAELQMSYYIEGDNTKFSNKTVKSVNPQKKVGSWTISDLTVEPMSHPVSNRNIANEKTTYLLSVYQSFNGKRSIMWYANIVRDHRLIQVNKIPDQSKGPIKVHPKDKVILNPQPIPPIIKKNRN